MIRFAFHKNHNSELPTFEVAALWKLSVVIQVIYLCPLFNLKMVLEIFLKPSKNVKGHKIACRIHFIFDRHLLDVSAVTGHGAVLQRFYLPYQT